MNVMLLHRVIVVSLIGLSTGAVAQVVDESALQALDSKDSRTAPTVREPAGAVELRAAMRRIAQQPDDADALADAGNAALLLGDANAALNFLARANTLRPRNGRITSALASATVRTENPFEALRLFDDAVRLGVSERSIAADRGLAFDLLGNFARAQQDYSLARTAYASDDLIIRQAISLSLAGQKNDADGMLLPLLQKNNPAAWRARAFMLAARGDARESAKVTQGFMDARAAEKMERYLRLMPDLTGAQQAAAIHLGHFPANNIGRDSAEVRRVAASMPRPEPTRNDSRLIPSGEPLGQKPSKADTASTTKKSDRKRERARAAKVAVLEPIKAEKSVLSTDTARARVEEARLATSTVIRPGALPPPEAARPSMRVALPSSAAAAASRPPVAVKVTEQRASVSSTSPIMALNQPRAIPAVSAPSPRSAVQGPAQTGAFAVAPATSAIVPSPVSAAPFSSPPIAGPASPTSIAPFDLAAIVGAIEIPETEQKPSAVPVDLNKLRLAVAKNIVADAAKADAAEAAKKMKPDAKTISKMAGAANPARFWVQIATGGASALPFDYRRLQKKNPALFKGQNGFTSAWGKTDRLLVGPFSDLKASKKWEAEFKKTGDNAFGWKSESGVVVTALKGK